MGFSLLEGREGCTLKLSVVVRKLLWSDQHILYTLPMSDIRP